MWQVLLINIWQLSAIHLLTSSPLKLCQVGWGETHIFRFLQKYLIGFKLGLWLGTRTFTALSISHSCCVLRITVLLEGKPSAQSEVLNGIFIMPISLFLCINLFYYSDESLSPCRWKNSSTAWGCYQHTTFWMVLCWWWAELVPFKHDTCNWGSSDPVILFLTVWSSFMCFFCCKFQVCFHVSSLRREVSLGTPP